MLDNKVTSVLKVAAQKRFDVVAIHHPKRCLGALEFGGPIPPPAESSKGPWPRQYFDIME